MAYIDVNKRVIDNINSDDMAAVLNSIIDNELAKDVSQMNTALVDECVEALLELEQEKDEHFMVLIPLFNPDEFLKKVQPIKTGWHGLNVFARASIVAAVLASTTLTVNAAYQSATGVNLIGNLGNAIQDRLEQIGIIKTDNPDDDIIEVTQKAKEDETTTEAVTEEPTTVAEVKKLAATVSKPVIEQIEGEDEEEETTRPHIEQIDGEDEDDDETTSTTRRRPEPTTVKPVKPTQPADPEKPEVTFESLSAEFDDDFKVDYIYGEELTYEGLTLTAHFSDGSSKTVPLEDTNYTKSVNMTVTGDHTLRIIYKTAVIRINITVRPDEDTRGAEICENELFDYMLTKNGAYITKYKGEETNLDINKVDGHDVFAIGADVFSGKNIKSVNAENCEKIFARAFKDCTELEACYTPRAKYIGDEAFENDINFKHPVFSNDLSFIGTAVYKNSGIMEISLSENISEVPDSLCENCADLTDVNLRGAAAVGKYAFSECTSLAQVSGTDELTNADDFAFYNCSNAEFAQAPAKLTSAGNSAFAYCNSIDFGRLNITEVDKYSFLYCHKLTEVEIDGSNKVIPEGSFRGTHIEKLTLNEGTAEIDDMAFMSTLIAKVELPSSVKRIGSYGLYSTKLREVYTTRNLTTIEESAFFRSRLTMYVYESSYAHNYSIENNVKFELIGNYNGVVQLDGEDD